MRITSTRVETRGAHDHVTVWVDGANVGTLILGKGQGSWLVRKLGGAIECPSHGALCHDGRCAVREAAEVGK